MTKQLSTSQQRNSIQPGVKHSVLTTEDQKVVQSSAASDLSLATTFVHQSGDRNNGCGKLCEGLGNSFAKGDNDCPDNLVSPCHLIDEHKSRQLKSATPDGSSAVVTFAQKKGEGKDERTKGKDDSPH
jgi:hypothetical protein